ncbi:MAG: hypothetical protein ABIT01_11580 [Thermoanaerobaculia bacterium]
MKNTVTLTITSLLSILLFTFHLADDICRGFERGDLSNLTALPICVVWMVGTLVLAGRRSGYVIVLLGSLLGLGVPFLHMMGKGVGLHGNIGRTSGAYFFVWTLLALGTTALFTAVLSAHGLWSSIRSGRQARAGAIADGRMSAVEHESPDRRG